MRSMPAVVLLAAAGAGYAYNHPELTRSLAPRGWVSEASEEEVVHVAANASDVVQDPVVESMPQKQVVARKVSTVREDVEASNETTPEIPDFGDIFRFDLTPQKIKQRWPRVSTNLSDVKYQGCRVPLITGTRNSDLVGSLTYYYDSKQQIRRITFVGNTANPKRFIDYMSKYYAFRQQTVKNAKGSVYQTKGRAQGEFTVNKVEGGESSSGEYRIVLSLSQ